MNETPLIIFIMSLFGLKYDQTDPPKAEFLSSTYFRLLFFSIILCLITYGFTLSNFSLSIDSEQVFFRDTSLSLGRWGTNLIRYHIFGGIIPYFTLLLSLFLLSLTAVELSKLFRLGGLVSYVFVGLFLTFPQMAYQLVFTMQADAVSLGFLAAAFSVRCFLKSSDERLLSRSTIYFVFSSLLFMFVIAIYQALAFIPIILYLIVFYQNTYAENYNLKVEFKKGLGFVALIIVSVILYFISVKIFCRGAQSGGFLLSYVTGDTNRLFSHFLQLWGKHLTGHAYYGDKTFIIASVIAIIMGVRFLLNKNKLWFLRIVLLFLLLLVPFIISFFITSGYNPPRLYVTSGISFAFVIVSFVSNIKIKRLVLILTTLIVLANVYYITMLFWSHHKLYHHDIGIAYKIDHSIRTKYPSFNPAKDYVYFFGHLPYSEDERFRLPHSEIFGGSFFVWDNGSNERIVNFMRFSDVAYYRYINNLQTYLKIKDSISSMPVWPNQGYIKLVDNVIIVKLGSIKGAPLWVEKEDAK